MSSDDSGVPGDRKPTLKPLVLEELPVSSPVRKFSPRGTIQCVGNYDLGKTIGKGQFGKVKLARHVLTGEKVAVKIIRKSKLDDQRRTLIRREIQILKMLNHSHVVRLYEVLETDRVLFLIMEYASGGEALDFIVAHGKLSEEKSQHLFSQLLSAIDYCHSRSVCHRDLKAENLLLDSDLNIKIIDFGLSNYFKKGSLLSTFCGSPTYAAPELIQKKPYDGPAVDIWSMGVILYVLVTGELPFNGTDLLSLYRNILNGSYPAPTGLSPECVDIIASMLTVDTSKRATIEQLQAHPWIKSAPVVTVTEDSETSVTQIDHNILDQMALLGYSEEEVISSIRKRCYDSAAGTYNLLLDKQQKMLQSLTLSLGSGRPLAPSPMRSGRRWEPTQTSFVMGIVSQPTSAATSPVGSPGVSPRHRHTHDSGAGAVSKSVSSDSTTPAINVASMNKAEFLERRRKRDMRRAKRGHKRCNSDKITELVAIVTEDNAKRNSAIVHQNHTDSSVTAKRLVRNVPPRVSLPKSVSDSSGLTATSHSPPPMTVSTSASAIIPTPSAESQSQSQSQIGTLVPKRKRLTHRRNKSMEIKEEEQARGESPQRSFERAKTAQATPVIFPLHRLKRKRSSTINEPVLPKTKSEGATVPTASVPNDGQGDAMVPSTQRTTKKVPRINAIRTQTTRRLSSPPAEFASMIDDDDDAHSANPLSLSVERPCIVTKSRSGDPDTRPATSRLACVTHSPINRPLPHSNQSVEVTDGNPTPFNTLLGQISELIGSRESDEDQEEPRAVRHIYNRSFTSMKAPAEIMAELKRVFDIKGLLYEQHSPCCWSVIDPDSRARFETEVCSVPNLSSTYFVKMRRVNGEWDTYRELCLSIIEQLEL